MMAGKPGSKLSNSLADIQDKFDEGAALNVSGGLRRHAPACMLLI